MVPAYAKTQSKESLIPNQSILHCVIAHVHIVASNKMQVSVFIDDCSGCWRCYRVRGVGLSQEGSATKSAQRIAASGNHTALTSTATETSASARLIALVSVPYKKRRNANIFADKSIAASEIHNAILNRQEKNSITNYNRQLVVFGIRYNWRSVVHLFNFNVKFAY